jgi:hypothetical protein
MFPASMSEHLEVWQSSFSFWTLACGIQAGVTWSAAGWPSSSTIPSLMSEMFVLSKAKNLLARLLIRFLFLEHTLVVS